MTESACRPVSANESAAGQIDIKIISVPTGHLLFWTSAAKEASLADIGEGEVMDDDDRELARQLFATATAMLEDMIGTAVAGQAPEMAWCQLTAHARRLGAQARDLAVIAEAASIAANHSVNHALDEREKRD